MTIRSIALALTSATAFAVAPVAPAAPAMAAAGADHASSAAHANSDGWRFVAQYRTLTACRNVGEARVASHRAHAYKCENDYTAGGAPALDLYVR